VPLLLDYDAQQGRWTLIATVSSCPDRYALGRPPAPYLQYETQGGLTQTERPPRKSGRFSVEYQFHDGGSWVGMPVVLE
jgi:hypothetical protein